MIKKILILALSLISSAPVYSDAGVVTLGAFVAVVAPRLYDGPPKEQEAPPYSEEKEAPETCVGIFIREAVKRGDLPLIRSLITCFWQQKLLSRKSDCRTTTRA